MPESIPIVALVASALFLAGMVGVLVLLRKGEGPRYGASRVYDANCREAVRVLTGEEVDRVTREQWFEPARRQPTPGDPLASPYGRAVAEALQAVVPPDREMALDDGGRATLASPGMRVLPALSTADLCAEDLEREAEGGRPVVGIVLFNPEPPGGDASRVALPVQALFPALERAGRADLVARFEALRRRGAEP